MTSSSGSASAIATGPPPALVVVDKKGIVRYTHIGEGDYEETEALIRKLLAEQ